MCSKCGNSVCSEGNPYDREDACAMCGEPICGSYGGKDYYGEPICYDCARKREEESDDEI